MDVQLTPGQQALVRQAVKSGRLLGEGDVLREALSLWEERERERAAIASAIGQAEASILRGEGRPITQESMIELAQSVQSRGRARLAAESK